MVGVGVQDGVSWKWGGGGHSEMSETKVFELGQVLVMTHQSVTVRVGG